VAFNIDDPAIENLARELAERTGENIATATRKALEERLRRVSNSADAGLVEDLASIRRRWAALPIIDRRPADEIIGYDENGLPR
jgi:antitoxin VapB